MIQKLIQIDKLINDSNLDSTVIQHDSDTQMTNKNILFCPFSRSWNEFQSCFVYTR